MKVIFLKHVINVWKVWEIKEVKEWYAMNFLFPHGYAKEYTEAVAKKLEQDKKKKESQRRDIVEHRQEIFDALNGKELEFHLERTESGKTFWSIWEKDIIARLEKDFKLHFSKGEIEMPAGHIKHEWKSDVFVKIGAWKMVKLIIVVK